MRLRSSMILVTLTLFAVATLASPIRAEKHSPEQHKAKADVISGEWDVILTTEDSNRQLTLKLKLSGNKVTGSFESSHLGNGAIQNGSWANKVLKISMETSHAPVALTARLQNGKLAGEWDAGHMQGKWEATKKKGAQSH
jgi:hypothetical protein